MSVRFRPPAPIFCKSPNKRYVHMKKHLLQVVIEQDEDGTYVADCPALKGCYAQGNTFEEAMKNIKDVIQMCLEELKEERKKVDLKYPEVIGMKWVEITI